MTLLESVKRVVLFIVQLYLLKKAALELYEAFTHIDKFRPTKYFSPILY